MRAFDTWTYEDVEDAFGIERVKVMSLFEDWMKPEIEFFPNETEAAALTDLQNTLFDEVMNWNEDELKLFFIGPLLSLIKFKTDRFKPFTQRTLSFTKDNISASGKMDFLLARGKVLPKVPYFCLHEYKQENRRDNDPLGQLLIGMVASQAKHQADIPIFGTYVSGRNWFFVLLSGKEYMLSDAFVATSDDAKTIFALLKKCKALVGNYAK